MLFKKASYFLMLISWLLISTACTTATGQLQIRANGEAFVRQGFVAKDGWAIDFDSLNVSLHDVRAYQTDPPYDASSGLLPEGKSVGLAEMTTIDLAAGDEDAGPILLATIEAPVGQYNAISWEMAPSAAGFTLQLIGTAEKGGTTIPFDIRIDQTYRYVCGEFVGDERKGFIDPNEVGEVEMTFHFDHLFGDAETDPSAPLNTGALGFEPLAMLATDGVLTATQAELQAGLGRAEYATLMDALGTLGHVGEGHCFEAENGYTGHGSE